ncbi:alpha-L-fucosidase [Entomoplasma freundtii]|uniref:alpha-L-fucosidase n=1 Tax=Entomoplasma freundtii TaxID=74700 RepID=A0A2K8NR81_9MOLU|nr:alpha-L-fucosidase [Entomoplasma freundtii]ATZ16297.1 alpha-L-fucosidase [Entomoplasma freundtii]TDY56801.1 alpha-L-fucosidase [Entomoplasma freundtii]
MNNKFPKITRVTNFRNLGLGFFLHFGLYNKIGKGEWYQNMYHLNSHDYYEMFSPLSQLKLNLDISGIVSLAKENNFGYLVLTTKHHDGFCFFDSEGLSEHDITETSTQNDIIEDFITQCRQAKILPILYFCTLDWMWDEKGIPFEEQLTLINREVEILCKKYPDLGGFWFDGNWSKKEADWQEEKLYQLIRSYIPEAIIVNNSGLTNAGKEQNSHVDVLTFEQAHLKEINYQACQRDLAAEACQSFNDHWGLANEDYNFKSVGDLILKFVEARKQKANYLLNVSLNENGKMLPLQIETIKVFGQWVKKYGFMLFDDYEILTMNNDDFIISTKDNQHFAFLYDLPSGGHVKVIQQGGKIQPPRSFNYPFDKIDKMRFLDNLEEINFDYTKENKKELIISPTAYNYGFNTKVRVLKISLNS